MNTVTPFIGQIQAFAFDFPPRGWAACNGQLLAIAQHQQLFSLLGTTYGGDRRTTFALPDLRGRSMVCAGQGTALDRIQMGQSGGSYQITLDVNQMPSHKHDVNVSLAAGEEASPGTNYIANHGGAFSESSDGFLNGNSITSTPAAGKQKAFNNRNPYLGVNICIALEGIYPSRS